MLEEMTYKEVDGLLYPQIEMPDETEDLTKLGKYGRMAMNYLKENEPARYKTLMRFGKMYEKMSAVEEEANQLYDQLEMQYLAKHKNYKIDEDWENLINKYLKCRKLNKELADAFVDKVQVFEDGRISVNLVYDDCLEESKK